MSAASAACVWVLSTCALSSLTHDTRDTSTLAPPFDGVLHSRLWLALSIVLAVAVGLTTVSSTREHGSTNQILSDLGFENIWKGERLAILHLDLVDLGEQTCVHLFLLDSVNQIVRLCLHLITLPACSRY